MGHFKMTVPRGGRLPAVLWLGFPLATLAILWLTPLLGYARWKSLMTDETGFVENATFVFLLPAIVLAFVLARRFFHFSSLPPRAARKMAWLMLILGLGFFYFAGEEVNWGQVWFHWKTPEAWAASNYQQQTSLHNLSHAGILNNVPRELLLTLVIVMALVLPIVFRRRRERLRGTVWQYLVPDGRLIPAAILAIGSSLPGKFFSKSHGVPLAAADYTYSYMAFIDLSGELKEYGFALVILLYMLSLYLQVEEDLSQPAPPAAS